jgi:DNA-binding transcriptional ArsR family regulator
MEKEIEHITSLIGDPVRTKILWALLDGRAYTATELAVCTETSPQNLSMHLSKLIQADLLAVESQGRHKYYRFARQEVAYAIEAISNLIPEENQKRMIIKDDNSAIRHCRTCYDHLAGKVGVMITESLLKQKMMVWQDKCFHITEAGEHFFAELNIDISTLEKQRRAFARPCLDWSERKHHLAGSVGAALLQQMEAMDWIRRSNQSRAVKITTKGQKELYRYFQMMV